MKKKQLHLWPASLVVIAVVAASCSKGSPTSPSGSADLPNPTGSVKVSINPSPVPFSGVPVTDDPGCATKKNTWYYSQAFTESSGNAVTLTSRVDFFDGFSVNIINGIAIDIPAKGSTAVAARWCSGNATNHTAQSTFSGVDAHGNPVVVNTPVIKLMAP
jgi:hypothetical protein